MNSTYNLVNNDTHPERIAIGKQYLQKNLTEIMTSAARIFKLVILTLHNFFKHDKDVEFGV